MIITRGEKKITVEGSLPNLNEKAPSFNLKNLDDKDISLESLQGETVLISVFPDIDTRVCDAQTRRFFAEASKYPEVKIVNVSNNTKEQLADWCATNGIDVEMLRDSELEFAKAYGIYMPEYDKLARSTFLVNKDGVLVYSELVAEMTDEPNYQALFSKVEQL